jgi:hypothetical protein
MESRQVVDCSLTNPLTMFVPLPFFSVMAYCLRCVVFSMIVLG